MGCMTFNRPQNGHQFVSGNHKTRWALLLHVNIINCVQRQQRQSDTEIL